jgi:trehalose/maltose hydrolase-like predicted phosphorylase
MKILRVISCLLAMLALSLPSSSAEKGEKGWVLRCNNYQCDYTGAPVANGTIGLLPWREPFSVRHLILNHIFDLSDRTGVNCMVKGINPFNVKMEVDGQPVDEKDISDWSQWVDMRNASHNTSFTACGKVRVTYSIVALRNMPYSALMNIRLTALKGATVHFTNSMTVPEEEYGTATFLHKSYDVEGRKMNILQTNAPTSHGRYVVCASSAYVFDEGKFDYLCSDRKNAQAEIKMTKGEQADLSVVASVCTTHDFTDPYSEAEREIIFITHQSVKSVLAAHRAQWDKLWQGDIEIEGDDEAQQVVRFALYNLYSYCRKGTALSISPMGLSSQGYNGHIFWDAETWMYPPMLLMNGDIARSMIDYRTNRLAAAKTRAAACGYDGAMFPWESDDYGQESTPTFALTGQFEQHISADIAIACWNYYCISRDKEWLREKGYPLISAVAEFIASRVERNDDGSYSINGVVGADEYAIGVDDNAYTNGTAIVALRDAVKAAKEQGLTAPAPWSTIADNLRILHDPKGFTSEYKGYNGKQIKQADVNLLWYPLGIVTEKKQVLADLAYYDDKIDRVNGPAMTFGIYCIDYARLGNVEKAEEMFRRCYRPNMRPPFYAFAETPTSHNPYFATGAGGLLQAVVYGFGGLEITDQGVVQVKSVLPKSWKRLTIKGVGAERKTFTVVQQ